MFPLPVILIGDNADALAAVRRELLNNEVKIEGEIPKVPEVLNPREDLDHVAALFVVHVRTIEDLRDVKRLTERLIGQPVLALVDEPSVDWILAAMRAGAMQVVPLPVEPADFKAALDCIRIQQGRSPKASRLIAVSGVAGGCGATTLAINLACELAQRHDQQTVLAELHSQLGVLVTYLDVEAKYTLDDLVTYHSELDIRLVEQALTQVTHRFSILAGPRKLMPATQFVQDRVRSVLRALRNVGDLVLLDVPCTFDEVYFETLAAADLVVLVGEQRIPSIRNVQLVLETFRRSGDRPEPRFVVNRYDSRLDGFTAPALAKFLRISGVTTVANDPVGVANALNTGRPLREAASRSPVLADVEALARTLFPRAEVQADKTPATVLGRLFRAFRFA